MPEKPDRLVRCFMSVFPTLTPDQARAATINSLRAWDSLATVTLVAVLEQEFSLEIDLIDFQELDSFESVQCYLLARKVDLSIGRPDPG